MNDASEIVGMVDVLKLTYATLEQINSMSGSDSEGPAWNKFWLSLDNETESVMSGEGSHHHAGHASSIAAATRRVMSPELSRDRIGDSVAPGDSASHVGAESPRGSLIAGPVAEQQSPADVPFPFKFKAPSGRVHRLQVTAGHGIEAFVANVSAKLGAEADAIGGVPAVVFDVDGSGGRVTGGYALSYLDDEGDSISITTDHDLLEAITLARQNRRDKVDLFVHDPEKPPSPAVAPEATAPSGGLLTPEAANSSLGGVRERKKAVSRSSEDSEEEEDEDEESQPVRRSRRARGDAQKQHQVQEQLIAGVPNDLLLPGAIVTLAVVIVGVFAISRATSR